MKKKTVLIVLFFASCGVWINHARNVNTNDLMLENIDAMANPEISVGPFCAVTKDICFQEPNGFFIYGYRLYF